MEDICNYPLHNVEAKDNYDIDFCTPGAKITATFLTGIQIRSL